MKIKNYLKYILVSVILISLNISGKVYSQNVDELYEKIDLFGDVLEKIESDYIDEIDKSKIMDSAIQILFGDEMSRSQFLKICLNDKLRKVTLGDS